MFKFRNLILAATAATIAIGGATAATTAPAQAAWFKHRDRDRVVVGVHSDRMTWRERRAERRAHRKWKHRKHGKHWWKKHERREARVEAAPRRYRPLK